MPKHLFIVSIPHERGIVQYHTQNMLMLLPEGYRITNREPIISVLTDEVLFTWRCEKITDRKPIEYKAGVIGNNTRNNRL